MQEQQHHGAPSTQAPSKAQGLKNLIPSIISPHTAAASSHQQHLQGKNSSCVCLQALSQQDSLFSWRVPDTSPSLRVVPVLTFPLSSLPASYRHKLGRGKTPVCTTLHNLVNIQVLNQSCPPRLGWHQAGRGWSCPLTACPALALGRAHSTELFTALRTAPPAWAHCDYKDKEEPSGSGTLFD